MKKILKSTLCFLLAAIMITSSYIFTDTFDIQAAADSATENESYISGYPDGTFKPDANVTRAEAVAILFRICEDLNKNIPVYKTKYPDVSQNDWFHQYVAFFETEGYLSIFKKNFEPSKPITRQEFVYLLSKVKEPESFSYRSFSDVDEDSTYYLSVAQAASAGYVTGYPDGTFKPEGNITRAETVTIVNRVLKRVCENTSPALTFSDISDHWAYEQIIVSANERTTLLEDGTQISNWTEKEPTYTYALPEGNTYKQNIDFLSENSSKMSAGEIVAAADSIIDAKIEEILSVKENTVEVLGPTYYVSNDGNDSNSGTSPLAPWKTITKVNSVQLPAHSAVLFRRGDTFRGNVIARASVTYSAYGEGERPKIYGSAKNYADKSLWQETEYKNVYRLTERIANVGVIAFDHSKELGTYNQTMFQATTDPTALSEDCQYASDRTTNEVFVYCSKGNPGSVYKSIEIGAFGHIFQIAGRGVTIDNLAIMYGGSHGVSSGTISDLTVTNCVFAWIGGSWLNETTRYGNAIEIYGGCNGYTVKNNYCYQMYDTGITVQYASGGNCTQRNVVFEENIVEYCAWGIEFYNTGYGENDTRLTKDFDIAYNAVRHTGYGWGRTNTGGAYQSCGMTPNTENFVVRSNILHTSSDVLLNLQPGGDEKIEFFDNIYIHTFGKMFGSYKGNSVGSSVRTIEQLVDVQKQENPTIVFHDVIPPTTQQGGNT